MIMGVNIPKPLSDLMLKTIEQAFSSGVSVGLGTSIRAEAALRKIIKTYSPMRGRSYDDDGVLTEVVQMAKEGLSEFDDRPKGAV